MVDDTKVPDNIPCRQLCHVCAHLHAICVIYRAAVYYQSSGRGGGGRQDEAWWRQQQTRRIRDSSHEMIGGRPASVRTSSNLGDSLRRGELRYDPVSASVCLL